MSSYIRRTSETSELCGSPYLALDDSKSAPFSWDCCGSSCEELHIHR